MLKDYIFPGGQAVECGVEITYRKYFKALAFRDISETT